MKTLIITGAGVAAVGLIVAGTVSILKQPPAMEFNRSSSQFDNPGFVAGDPAPVGLSPYSEPMPAKPSQAHNSSLAALPDDPVSETVPTKQDVETFLTSAELQTLHSQLLSQFSGRDPSEIGESIPVNLLGLDRTQRYQLFLEPGDQIVLINDNSIGELANNPAVGSMLAGPTMKLAIERGPEMLEVSVSAY